MSDQDVIDGLRAQLKDALRENEILLMASGHVPLSVLRPALPPVPRDNHRMQYLEHAVEKLEDVLVEWSRQDCFMEDSILVDGYAKTDPCGCRPCHVRRVLAEVHDWRFGGSREEPSRRFVGAMFERTKDGWWPREAKIHQAWASYLTDRQGGNPDLTFGRILSSSERPDWPSARDWYVATSVVQWLATSCGMAVLEAAGFEYAGFDEDRVAVDAKRAAR